MSAANTVATCHVLNGDGAHNSTLFHTHPSHSPLSLAHSSPVVQPSFVDRGPAYWANNALLPFFEAFTSSVYTGPSTIQRAFASSRVGRERKSKGFSVSRLVSIQNLFTTLSSPTIVKTSPVDTSCDEEPYGFLSLIFLRQIDGDHYCRSSM